ncbi:MAG: glycosyltransferase family 4 protein [Nitrospiria bacterium]
MINDLDFFLSHRLSVAQAAQKLGCEIHVAAPCGESATRVVGYGFSVHQITLDRAGIAIHREIKTAISIFRLYRRLRPRLVEHITIKPVIYGSLVGRIFFPRCPLVLWVTGLGSLFLARDIWRKALRASVEVAYRFAFNRQDIRVIFENSDDREYFVSRRLLWPSIAVVIRGAGVDLSLFGESCELDGSPIVVLASRMIWDKGIREFVDAAADLKAKGVKARFVLVGESDSGNPTAVPRSMLESWSKSGVVEWWGFRSDMPAVFRSCHIACLPSYREGAPKVLLEAAASARPIIATDVPGCREIVRHGENGLLVPPRDPNMLAEALRYLIDHPEERRRMGVRGREIAVAEFSAERVVDETIKVYESVFGRSLQSVFGHT